jgi:hypothetical protein
MRTAVADIVPSIIPDQSIRRASKALLEFPDRPDRTVLNETIPLFYIGQNRKGLWVVREAEGRSGGLFLFRRSAVRFAREESEPSGCALMFLNSPLELDVNRGDHVVGPFAAALQTVECRAPRLAAFVGMAVAQWRRLVARVSRALADERRNREAIERELFRGQYRLTSKSDDDLPVCD